MTPTCRSPTLKAPTPLLTAPGFDDTQLLAVTTEEGLPFNERLLGVGDAHIVKLGHVYSSQTADTAKSSVREA